MKERGRIKGSDSGVEDTKVIGQGQNPQANPETFTSIF